MPLWDNIADILLKFVEKTVLIFAGQSVCERLAAGADGRVHLSRLWN